MCNHISSGRLQQHVPLFAAIFVFTYLETWRHDTAQLTGGDANVIFGRAVSIYETFSSLRGIYAAHILQTRSKLQLSHIIISLFTALRFRDFNWEFSGYFITLFVCQTLTLQAISRRVLYEQVTRRNQERFTLHEIKWYILYTDRRYVGALHFR